MGYIGLNNIASGRPMLIYDCDGEVIQKRNVADFIIDRSGNWKLSTLNNIKSVYSPSRYNATQSMVLYYPSDYDDPASEGFTPNNIEHNIPTSIPTIKLFPNDEQCDIPKRSRIIVNPIVGAIGQLLRKLGKPTPLCFTPCPHTHDLSCPECEPEIIYIQRPA